VQHEQRDRRAQRQARYEAVRALHDQGVSARQIARRLAVRAEQLERFSAQARQSAEKAQAKARESRQAADAAAARLLELRGRS